MEQTEEYDNLALLERVELCDEVQVEYPDFGISAIAKVTKTVYDVMTGSYSSVTLGDVRPSLSATVSGQEGNLKDAADSLKYGFQSDLNNAKKEFNDSLEGTKNELNGNINDTKNELNGNIGDAKKELNDTIDENKRTTDKRIDDLVINFQKALDATKTDLEKATEEATDWITNGRGYMVAVKNEVGQWIEICSLDDPDIAKAINVWRWNNGGFGHSSHGYNGPYEVAITQDGKINADFIVTGTLSADLIRGGNLLIGGSKYGDIVLYGYDPETGEDVVYGYLGRATSIELLTCDVIKGFVNIKTNISGEPMFTSSVQVPYSMRFCRSEHDVDPDLDYAEISFGYAYVGTDVLDGPFDGLLVNTNGHGMYTDRFYSSMSAASIALSKDYGSRVLTTNYSTNSIVEDLGEGETDENGKCYVYFDDVFLETVSSNVEYQVFIQKEGSGDIWVSEKTNQYFLVEGTELLKFSWMAKVKRKGNEYDRMNNYYVPSLDSINYEEAYYKETKKITNESIEENEKDQLNMLEDIIKEKEEAIYEAIK